jgi:hypothetical protein
MKQEKGLLSGQKARVVNRIIQLFTVNQQNAHFSNY